MSNLLATQTYRANQINGASPLDLLLMTYDAALIGCGQHDLNRTIKALNLLRDTLDYSYDHEIALGFLDFINTVLIWFVKASLMKSPLFYENYASPGRKLKNSIILLKI